MITVITLSKNLLDYETLYWEQFVEREKAIARLTAIMEVAAPSTEVIRMKRQINKRRRAQGTRLKANLKSQISNLKFRIFHSPRLAP